MKFSQKEINDLLLSWIVLSVAFAVFRRGGIFRLMSSPGAFLEMPVYIVQMLIIVGTAFVLHELSHKYVAQNYNLWAEYRKWTGGLLMALFLSLTGFIFFAAPGAVMVGSTGWITPEIEAKTSIAGPASNIAVGIVALLVMTAGVFPLFLRELALINFFLAVFNLIPIPPMDGSKILRYDMFMWLVAIGSAVVLLIITL
jgi:Zn-dependent protease